MSADLVEALCSDLPGRVHRPATPGYARATTPRNSTAVQHPAAVVAAKDAADVAGCLRQAGAYGRQVVVQASGHGAARPVDDRAVLLDTSGIDAVEVDPARHVVRAGAGATFATVNAAAFQHGLLAAAGTAPDVALAGYTAYGGVGWLTRPYGLASASLLAVEVVDGAGRRFRADDDQHPEVLWAYRGGGGVGVATRLELRLFPAHELWAGLLLWPVDQIADLAGEWGDGLPQLHPALSSTLAVLHAPAAPIVPEALRGQPVVHLSAASVAGEEACRTLRRVLERLPEPALDTLGPCDATRLSTIHLDPPAPIPAVGEGRWLTAAAGSRAVEILTAAGTGPDSPLGEVELRHVAVPASDVPGALTSPPGDLLLHATGAGPDPGARRATEAALQKVLAAAATVDTGRSAAAFRDGQDNAPDALHREARQRLAGLRRSIDPGDVISVSRPLDQ